MQMTYIPHLTYKSSHSGAKYIPSLSFCKCTHFFSIKLYFMPPSLCVISLVQTHWDSFCAYATLVTWVPWTSSCHRYHFSYFSQLNPCNCDIRWSVQDNDQIVHVLHFVVFSFALTYYLRKCDSSAAENRSCRLSLCKISSSQSMWLFVIVCNVTKYPTQFNLVKITTKTFKMLPCFLMWLLRQS